MWRSEDMELKGQGSKQLHRVSFESSSRKQRQLIPCLEAVFPLSFLTDMLLSQNSECFGTLIFLFCRYLRGKTSHVALHCSILGNPADVKGEVEKLKDNFVTRE